MSGDEEAATIVDKLYDFRDNFVEGMGVEALPEKAALVRAETEKTLGRLRELEGGCSRTHFLLQCGRALNASAEYSAEGEECLAKVVKRDPSLVEGWNLLGETFWKKGDVAGAKNCFDGALKRGKNKRSLRSLSMVLRQIPAAKAGDVEKNVLASVGCAKDAVQLDMDDGHSWYILGNAYLSLFFLTQQNAKVLELALNCYGKAESAKASSRHDADLHYNRGQAHKYKEAYEAALKGWQRASQLDPDWQEPVNKIRELTNFLDKTTTLISQKGKLKNRRIQNLLNSFSPNDLGPYLNGSYIADGKKLQLTPTCLGGLQEGANPGKVVTMKVLCNMADMGLVPFTFIAMDKSGEVFAVTVYNLNKDSGVIIGDTVALANPRLISHDIKRCDDVEDDGRRWTFQCLRVDNPIELVVNKRRLTSDHCAYTEASMSATQQQVKSAATTTTGGGGQGDAN